MLASQNPNYAYQVGGSLPLYSASYVRRQADEDLLTGLLNGEFCYVFNARQMGKSSLRVQTLHRLQGRGVRCGVLDMTAIGTHEITAEQWYASVIGFLVKEFRLTLPLAQWWRDRAHLSLISRLGEFLESVLLCQIGEPVVIFIDEIDSVLSLPFSVDDFFALIRACYNRRAEQEAYRRLSFALFGVATPRDLIADPTRTPFNIGRAIELDGFQFAEATPLLTGLGQISASPAEILHRVLTWTGGQPFLTQKLCDLIARQLGQEGAAGPETPPLAGKALVDWVVYARILQNWEAQDEPEHLKTIRDRLLYDEAKTGRLLGLYQRLLGVSGPLEPEELTTKFLKPPVATESVPFDNSAEQTALLLSGLVERRGSGLSIKNPIYQAVFNPGWVAKQLDALRPYAPNLRLWAQSGFADSSRLLRGQALQEVLAWAEGKSLSDLDYRFMAASQECDRQEVQAHLEAERLQEVEARLELERQRSLEQSQSLNRQRTLLGVISGVMVMAIAFGLLAYSQYQRTALSELRAIALSSDALFASNQRLDALIQAIKGQQRLRRLDFSAPDLRDTLDASLRRVLLSIQEANRLSGHRSAVLTVAFSPDGQQLVSGSVDGSLKFWRRDGHLLRTLQGHQSVIRVVRFSPRGDLFASTGDDKTIKLWTPSGDLVRTIPTQIGGIWSLDFSPDGSSLIVGGSNDLIEEHSIRGPLIQTLRETNVGVRAVAFSPDGKTIAAGCMDNTIKLWTRDGVLRQTLRGHDGPVQSLAFSPDGALMVSGSDDRTIKLWQQDGTLLSTLPAHETMVKELRFHPDGQSFASASWDKTIKLWTRDGRLLNTLRGHDAAIWGMAFSPDGRAIASAGAENTVILWKTQSDFQQRFYGLTGSTRKLLFSPDGASIALVGTDKTIKLWTSHGRPLKAISGHTGSLTSIDISPDGQEFASSSEDKTIRLWSRDGTPLKTLTGHTSTALSVVWHPDGQSLASSDVEGVILLWSADGTRLKTLRGHRASVWDVGFSPDGELLASGGNDSLAKIWSREGRLLHTLEGHQAAVWKVVFSPDGQLLATGSGDKTAKLWTRDGQLVATLAGHQAAIWGIAFSPDGQMIATASVDATIRLWRRDGQLITTLEGHQSGVRSVAFHPTAPILASAGDDQTLMLWDLNQILSLDPLQYACGWVGDFLRTNPTVEPGDRTLCRDLPRSPRTP